MRRQQQQQTQVAVARVLRESVACCVAHLEEKVLAERLEDEGRLFGREVFDLALMLRELRTQLDIALRSDGDAAGFAALAFRVLFCDDPPVNANSCLGTGE